MKKRQIKKKLLTVSVGIPAFNEEANIEKIIFALLSQIEDGYTLDKVMIVTDGCTDKTVAIVQKLKQKKVMLLIGKNRRGKSYRMNQLFKYNKSDLLIIIDADIHIHSEKLFTRFVKRINWNTDTLIGISAIPLPASNFFARCINYSMELQLEIRKSWNSGDNYLCYRGAFLAFTKKFIAKIRIPSSLVNNDTYFYFLAKKYSFHPRYIPELYVEYQSPKTFQDHLGQSSRFQGSKDELDNFFALHENDYTIPPFLIFLTSLKYFIKNPIYFSGYIVVFFATKIFKHKTLSSKWKVSTSTKMLLKTQYE